MNQIPRILYTKCLKEELQMNTQTLYYSGVIKKHYFSELSKLLHQVHISETETAIRISIEGFCGDKICFNEIEDGIWENNSPILMNCISVAE